jgi:hypothetical protein
MIVKAAAVQQLLMNKDFTNKHVYMATIGNSNRGTVFCVRSMLRI